MKMVTIVTCLANSQGYDPEKAEFSTTVSMSGQHPTGGAMLEVVLQVSGMDAYFQPR